MEIKYAGFRGNGRRLVNQDELDIIDKYDSGHFMVVVCDGMGGHDRGDVASQIVRNNIVKFWMQQLDIPDSREKYEEICRLTAQAVDDVSKALNIYQMGSTMVMASIEENKITITHIGDSRCYLLRKGYYDTDDSLNSEKDDIVYQTEDHVSCEYGWEIVERCFLSFNPQKAKPDIAQFELKKGDRILLCSDGVYRSMSAEKLKRKMLKYNTPKKTADALRYSCEKNADDYYTAIVIMIE